MDFANFTIGKTESGVGMVTGEAITRVLNLLVGDLQRGQFIEEDLNFQSIFSKTLEKDAIQGKKKAADIHEDYEIVLTVTARNEETPQLEKANEDKIKKRLNVVGGSNIRVKDEDDGSGRYPIKKYIIHTDTKKKHLGIRSLIAKHKDDWMVQQTKTFQNGKEINYCPVKNSSQGKGRKRSQSKDINYASRKKKIESPVPSCSNIENNAEPKSQVHQSRVAKKLVTTKRVASEIIQSEPKRTLVQTSSRPLNTPELTPHSQSQVHQSKAVKKLAPTKRNNKIGLL